MKTKRQALHRLKQIKVYSSVPHKAMQLRELCVQTEHDKVNTIFCSKEVHSILDETKDFVLSEKFGDLCEEYDLTRYKE